MTQINPSDDKGKMPLMPPRMGMLDPAQIRAKQLAEEEQKRFNELAEKIIKILIKERLTHKELPRLFSTIGTKIDEKIHNSELSKVMKL